VDRTRLRDELVIAVALAEFSYWHQATDPELSKRAWQLAVDRLADVPVEPYESLEALRAVGDREPVETVELTPITDPESQ
jgi:hypothetical protein